ncbi:MAG: hypothetical protein JOZ16_10330 [Methylobacteriaceae bacterium]|nr:hypothetical protein [Methylobacteriaceae bacterium]
MRKSSAPADPPWPQFTPVPTRARRDGWTAARQRAFLLELARIGLVSAAAQAVGMSRKSAYALRARAGAESFAAAWDEAIEIGHHEALGTAIDRAINGYAVPVYYRGVQVGTDRKYNEKLLIAALRATGAFDNAARRDPAFAERKVTARSLRRPRYRRTGTAGLG